MTNPWFKIPASDYEGHMSSPDVAQQEFLARVFRKSINEHDSRAIALLGCATGNGLQYVKCGMTKKITAVDFNPEYIGILRRRYEKSVPCLDIVEADLEKCILPENDYSLIFAGLVFEYLNPEILLPKISMWLKTGGVMTSVLQLPARDVKQISETSYSSLNSLKQIMKLVSPKEFRMIAEKSGLREREKTTVTLSSGKPFFIGTYERE